MKSCWNQTTRLLVIATGLVSIAAACEAVGPVTSAEMRLKGRWVSQHLRELKSPLPFSFVYDGKSSDALLPSWQKATGSRKLSKGRTERTITWTDAKTGLVVRWVSVEYRDYPVIEWTVYLKNSGSTNTPIIENIQGLDAKFDRKPTDPEFVLRGNKGDWCVPESYEPFALTMGPSFAKKFSPPDYSGKSCDGPDGWPYYNLVVPGGGVILAVGWPGQWQSSFTRDAANGLRVLAGQQLTHLYLKPGEEIRTPLIAMLFWQGKDTMRAQNIWRRWYMAHVIPHMDGKPMRPIQVTGGGTGLAKDIDRVDAFLDAGVKLDLYWRDAGAEGPFTWYPSDVGPYRGNDQWLNTGTWEFDRRQLPDGLRPFSDLIHQRGMKMMLWFEVERVGSPESWLGKNHPEWLLPKTESTVGQILDEGNPEAWKWLVNHVDGIIKSEALDVYREDMNGGGPLTAWRANDAPDRQGITENFYVQGHLAYWDELQRRNPGMLIDSCASGGRRNDLETMRRAVPFLRSDFQWPTMAKIIEGNQAHTYGLSMWLPWYGTGCGFADRYGMRSSLTCCYIGFAPKGWEKNRKQRADVTRNYGEANRIAPFMLGDYYPLSDYSLDLDKWMAWQFDRPEQGDGCVQAFRRDNCEGATVTYRLNGLRPKAQYELTNIDTPNEKQVISGRDLMSKGLTIEIKDKPGAAIVVYKKVK